MRLSKNLWVRAYRLLLFAYPRAVRRKFGADMADCFDDLRAGTRRRGRSAEINFVVRTLWDLPRSAIKAHAERFGWRRAPGPSHPNHPTRITHRNGLVMESVLQDVRFALRGFRKHPGFALLAVLSLALGVGANTTMISAVNGILWQELPVPEPDRLVRVYELRQGRYTSLSYPNFDDLREQADVFAGMFLHGLQVMGLRAEGQTQVVYGESVSASYFQVLGIEPALGRFFTAPESDDANAPPIVVISHSLWHRVFGADPDVVGRVVRINDEPMAVVGVAPEGFDGTKFALGMDAWIPAKIWARMAGWGNWTDARGSNYMKNVARLADGVSLLQAREAAATVAAMLSEEYPVTNRETTFAVFPETIPEPAAADLPNLIGLLAIAVSGLVLLVACANVASLLFARGAVRHREVGVRVALGAGRSRIVRQLLTESVVLALLGGAVGTALSYWTTEFVRMFFPNIPYRIAVETNPDAMVLGVAVVVSAGAAFAFGLLPAFQTTRPDVASVIKGDSGSASPLTRRGRMLNGVVVSMVALSFVTLLLSGLFTKSLDNVRETHPGFATDQRLLAAFEPGLAGASGREALSFFTELEGRVGNLPGVRAASFVSHVPLGGRTHDSRVYADDRTYEPEQLGSVAWRSSVMPGYFATIGTRVIRGREFNDGDHADVPRRVIINETLARRFWPDDDAVGKRLRYSRVPDNLTLEVVGVVEDGPYTNAGEAPQAAMFSPLAQVAFSHATLVVHGALDPVTLVSSIRDEARSIDPAVPMYDVKTMAEHLTGALWLFRMGAGLGSALGILALVLATAGLYGVMAFAVGQRARELGIRIALGANNQRVVMLVLRFDVEASDPVIFGGVVLGLGLVAFIASFVPAWGATRANPMESLRTE